MYEVLILQDSTYPLPVSAVADVLNALQSTFRITFIDEQFELPTNDHGEICPNAVFDMISAKPWYDSKGRFMVFTHRQLEDNYFGKTKKNVLVKSTFDWEYLTDVPLELGVAYIIAKSFYFQIKKGKKFHDDTRMCPFDFKAKKEEIDMSIKVGRLCAPCQKEFDDDPNVDSAELAVVSSLLQTVSQCWQNQRPFAAASSLSTPPPDDATSTKWPFIPTGESGFFTRDIAAISKLEDAFIALDASRRSGPSQTKGETLEAFSKLLFDSIDGFQFCGQDLRLQDCEVDLSYRIDSQLSDLHGMLAPMVFVECKNRAKAASVQDISHHIVRVSHRGLKAGIFVSTGGISGYSPDARTLRDSLAVIVEEYRQNGRLILPLVWEDLVAIRRGFNIHSLLNSKVTEIILK